jgi:hypothetical protein
MGLSWFLGQRKGKSEKPVEQKPGKGVFCSFFLLINCRACLENINMTVKTFVESLFFSFFFNNNLQEMEANVTVSCVHPGIVRTT